MFLGEVRNHIQKCQVQYETIVFKSFTHAQTSIPSGLVTNLVVVLCASSSNVLWVTLKPGVTGANVGFQTMLCGNLDKAALVLPIV